MLTQYDALDTQYLACVRCPRVSPLLTRQMESQARGDQEQQQRSHHVWLQYYWPLDEWVIWPPGQSLMSSELQSPVTSGQAVSQVELEFNFTRDSWASLHTRLLFLAPAAGNFVRDGKLVFIHIKIVCMFVFSCFHSRMFMAAAGSTIKLTVTKTQLQKFPIIQFSQKLVLNTINPSEITESTNDNYWFS